MSNQVSDTVVDSFPFLLNLMELETCYLIWNSVFSFCVLSGWNYFDLWKSSLTLLKIFLKGKRFQINSRSNYLMCFSKTGINASKSNFLSYSYFIYGIINSRKLNFLHLHKVIRNKLNFDMFHLLLLII